MTQYLTSKYNNKTLDLQTERLISFTDFNDNNSKTKNLTISIIFAKQLITLFRMSGDRAKAILDQYPTPSALLEAYESETEPGGLLESLPCGTSGRKLGTQLSNFIYQLYCSPDYDLSSFSTTDNS